MLNAEVEEALNGQINAEIYSSYLYYSMAAYFEGLSLKGFAHWMRVQALEEMTHVHKLFVYVHDRGGRARMLPIDAPPGEWDSPLAAFESVCEHEAMVTALVNRLMDLALSKSDHATSHFLQWFVAEQVEEESAADEALQKLKLVDRTEGGLFMVDQEMDKRTFVPLPELAGAF